MTPIFSFFFSHLQNHENVFYTLDNNLTLFILFKSFTLESLGAPSVNPLCNGLAKNFFVFFSLPHKMALIVLSSCL